MRLLIILITAASLFGCAHNLTIQAADGSGGTGTASRGMGAGSIEVTIDGHRYEGRWTAATEGSVTFGTLISGSRMASGSAMTIGGSRGMALLRSPSGGALRCEFIYSGMSMAGYGGCQDANGKRFDLLIG
jgi:hypothetical protein